MEFVTISKPPPEMDGVKTCHSVDDTADRPTTGGIGLALVSNPKLH